MKKLIFSLVSFISTLALIFSSFPAQSVSAASSTAERLAGRIVLQVQNNGEAWYISPVDYKRYYLGRPRDAWNIMRALGLGATDANLARVPINGTSWTIDKDMIKYVKGRILIQVQLHGEAWYVSPVNLHRYYMGRPADAFQLMRNLGLGITNSDLAKIEVGTVNVDNSTNSNSTDNSSDSSSDNTTNNQAKEGQLSSDNFTYQGSFMLPDEFDWGARGITYYPKGNNGAGSLLITGFELPRNNNYEECTDPDNCFAYYGEVNIPTPKVVNNFEDASLATLQGNTMRKLDDGRACYGDCSTTWISDIEYVPKNGTQTSDKLYASRTLWYAEGDLGTNTFPTIWFTNFNGSNVQGLFNVGNNEDPFHGRKMGDYLFSVPDWYANKYLGGRTLVTGRSRGTPGVIGSSNTSAGSQGPTMFAFKPFSSDTASGNLDALPMLYYRTFFPECAGPNVGDKANCDYPDFTMNDTWTGASFVETGSKSAFMLLGIKGLGNNCYDNADGSGIACNDPCSDAHGYHCNPYEREVIFYDVSEIGKIAQGEKDPWSVVPYEIWRPDEFFFDGQTCSGLGGMTFDQDNNRLYMIEKGLDGFNNINRAAVHVFEVK